MSHILRTAAAALVSFALVACADPSDDLAPAQEPSATEADDTATAEEDLSASSRSYVTIRRDYRKCMAPMCGGYWVRDVNRKTSKETYVSALDFSASGLDEAAQGLITSAADGEIVLRAKLGKVEKKFNTRKLVVDEAFRGLPGKASLAGEGAEKAGQVYAVKNLDIKCITAPCNTFEIKRLNYTPTTRVAGLDLDLGNLVDQAWLLEEVSRDGGLVLGSVRPGEKRPGGVESILDAGQVFIKVPETNSCPQFKLAACPEGQVRGYHRDEKRCIIPDACVESRMCALMVPSCEEGFSLVSWTGGYGCSAYACDPTWILPVEE